MVKFSSHPQVSYFCHTHLVFSAAVYKFSFFTVVKSRFWGNVMGDGCLGGIQTARLTNHFRGSPSDPRARHRQPLLSFPVVCFPSN